MNNEQLLITGKQNYETARQNSVINLAAYRAAKTALDRNRQSRQMSQMIANLRLSTDTLRFNKMFNDDWAEMDRIFTTLYEMGAIPQVEVNFHA